MEAGNFYNRVGGTTALNCSMKKWTNMSCKADGTCSATVHFSQLTVLVVSEIGQAGQRHSVAAGFSRGKATRISHGNRGQQEKQQQKRMAVEKNRKRERQQEFYNSSSFLLCLPG